MFKEKDFVLHFAGLIVLTLLAVFFAILQAKYNIEITDVGMILGGITGIVGVHGANAYNRLKKDDNDETSV